VDPRSDLDDVEKRKSCFYRNSNSDPSAVQSVASLCVDCSIPAIPYSEPQGTIMHKQNENGDELVFTSSWSSALYYVYNRPDAKVEKPVPLFM
jgi:hypothetical protein